MQYGFFRHLGNFVLLLVIQILIMNNIRFCGYINPYVYVLFVLLLPVDTKGWVLLLSAFATGLVVDLFSDTQGMHAAATVFMAFTRPGVIRMVSGRTEFDPGTLPTISVLGARRVIFYSFILIVLHHSILFFLEIFRFSEIFETLARILLSSGITFILVFFGFIFFDKPGKKVW